MDNPDILEYKNFYLFYQNLYERLFNLITLLIDEREYNIVKLKNASIDFLDSYSYYLVKQKLITKENKEKPKLNLLTELQEFSNFYKSIEKFPSDKYKTIHKELDRQGYDLTKLSNESHEFIIIEYYTFFNELLTLLKRFIDVTSECGFLPNIKSKTALKSIGYSNFDKFFTNLENLKQKASEMTSNVNITNHYPSRRVMYCILIIFSPYFKNKVVYDILEKDLSFKFLEDKTKLELIRKINTYKDINGISRELKENVDKELILPLKTNISVTKRYISFEFGERDMSPTIKKKYDYDPTGV